jgi:hypothetical protein
MKLNWLQGILVFIFGLIMVLIGSTILNSPEFGIALAIVYLAGIMMIRKQ